MVFGVIFVTSGRRGHSTVERKKKNLCPKTLVGPGSRSRRRTQDYRRKDVYVIFSLSLRSFLATKVEEGGGGDENGGGGGFGKLDLRMREGDVTNIR